MKRLVLSATLFLGCGVEPASTLSTSAEPVTLTPLRPTGQVSISGLHCGAEPTDNGNGTSTAAACPFEQQFRNITANGTPSTAQLWSNSQPVALTASMKCNQWVMGNDASGATVFVSTSDGSVLSHGAFHAGYPVSVLPSTLQLPLTFAP